MLSSLRGRNQPLVCDRLRMPERLPSALTTMNSRDLSIRDEIAPGSEEGILRGGERHDGESENVTSQSQRSIRVWSAVRFQYCQSPQRSEIDGRVSTN